MTKYYECECGHKNNEDPEEIYDNFGNRVCFRCGRSLHLDIVKKISRAFFDKYPECKYSVHDFYERFMKLTDNEFTELLEVSNIILSYKK